ncbi:MAG: nucleoside recognition domain-containing protein [Candidatus Omnitrophota bacterium]
MDRSYKGPIEYSIEIVIENISNLLVGDYYLSKRSIALLLLQEDSEVQKLVLEKDKAALEDIEKLVKEAKDHYINPVTYELAIERQKEVQRIVQRTVSVKGVKASLNDKISSLSMHPISGLIILFIVLYFGMYQFVAKLGAGTVVGFLEGKIFNGYITPFFAEFFNKIIPFAPLRDLFIGEYGIISMWLRYAFAVILPIVTFFFIIFSIIEDSGYLPRLAMLIDRFFKKIGLSGRAVIPMVLGFGCATMATLVTRILPTKRERVIATMLLALAVPCSAQLGIIVALFSGRPKALCLWAGVLLFVFLLIGYLSALVLPGERPSFYMEIPPLRFPKISNVLKKTFLRVKWYFKEVIVLFVAASFIIWLGELIGLFSKLVKLLEAPVKLIGLPAETAKAFLFGFFRRDYGAAGLYDLNKAGILNGVQLVVACVALTLFLPCVAQFIINVKERGIKTALGISVFVLFFSFSVAYVLNQVLLMMNIIF